MADVEAHYPVELFKDGNIKSSVRTEAVSKSQLEQLALKHINSDNPLGDFQKMISNNNKDNGQDYVTDLRKL